MKTRTTAVLIATLSCALLAASCAKKGADTKFTSSVNTPAEKLGYAMGVDIGRSLKTVPGTIDRASLFQGISDGWADARTLLSADECKAVKDEAYKKLQEERAAKRAEEAGKNMLEAKTFLEKNRLTANVNVTASGLQYLVLTNGTGRKPKADDVVRVAFRGTLLDGSEFDSSEKRKGPILYRVSNAMKGIAEALQLMPVGSKWRVYVPPELGYGLGGMPPKVGPNALLIFELELLEIVKPAAARRSR